MLEGKYSKYCFMILYRGQNKARWLRDSQFKEEKEYMRPER
jgi:hypothetical protein